ncbi:cytochrome c-type biogenesis CcmF C-terminal domain-containing protein, partial [Citrobacter freundii]|uniref:cytochrome c-type biogenesis CcmF C-terminal domain-containing protein n=1 Tax=Citrobacter freundii TaxID=546 RepID=UPI001CD54FDF
LKTSIKTITNLSDTNCLEIQGASLLDNGAWAVRLYYKPFIRWIWAGGLLMALGGLFCLFDPRYRQRTRPRAAVQKNASEAV